MTFNACKTPEHRFTHHPVYNRMLTKQDNLTRGADQPFPFHFGTSGFDRGEILCQLFDRT